VICDWQIWQGNSMLKLKGVNLAVVGPGRVGLPLIFSCYRFVLSVAMFDVYKHHYEVESVYATLLQLLHGENLH
jgi:hypothetical protein